MWYTFIVNMDGGAIPNLSGGAITNQYQILF